MRLKNKESIIEELKFIGVLLGAMGIYIGSILFFAFLKMVIVAFGIALGVPLILILILIFFEE